MKYLERLVLSYLRPYVIKGGVEDAIMCLPQQAHSHLDKADSTSVMSFYFSSAFNTTLPLPLLLKL